ncbi:MAG: epoxyqueuosine reductase [Desulfobacteria bacterium]
MSDVGIVTKATLEGGPPSTDLSYVLPNAKSAICFSLPLDEKAIESFLKKEDRCSHEIDQIHTNALASGISLEIAMFLEQKGYPSVAQAANIVYRRDTEKGPLGMKPPISHRYMAVRSGIGHFGYSGNVITKNEGASIVLGTLVTEADLISTDPLPEEENYCDKCRLCNAACASGLMSQDEEVTVTMGGFKFSYSKRRDYNRCGYVCGGFTGLHQSGKWSTWSPGRFAIPENDGEFQPAMRKTARAYRMRMAHGKGFFSFLMPGYRVEFTCGHCMLVCHPDKEVRKKRYEMLIESGVIVENPADGSCEAVSPEEAARRIAAMNPEVRAMYEEV